jgi:hypothetical protein
LAKIELKAKVTEILARLEMADSRPSKLEIGQFL